LNELICLIFAEQFCPPFQNAEFMALSIKSSLIFASSKTINGLFPPISRATGFKLLSLEYFKKYPPTSVEPVKETASTSL
jgi:hypothetical protein